MEAVLLQAVFGLINPIREAQRASTNYISVDYRTRKIKTTTKERNSFKFCTNVVGRDSLVRPAQVCRRMKNENGKRADWLIFPFLLFKFDTYSKSAYYTNKEKCQNIDPAFLKLMNRIIKASASKPEQAGQGKKYFCYHSEFLRDE